MKQLKPIENLKTVEEYLREGNQLNKEGNLEKAINKYSAALRIEPNFVPALNQLAEIYESQEKFARAISYYQHISELKPKNGQVRAKLAAMFMRQGNTQEAIATYQKAIDLQPDLPAWVYNSPQLFHSEHNEPRNKFHGLTFQVRLNGLWLLDREFILWLARMK